MLGEDNSHGYYTFTYDNKNAGTGKTVTCSGITLAGTDKANYSVSSSKTTTANITAKTLTITAANKSMTYGGSAPSYTYTSSGIVSGESPISGTATYTIKSGSTTVSNVSTANVGSYSIVPSGLTIGSNYTANYVNGTLTINKANASCTISASPTLTYPGSATGNITYSCTGDGALSVTSSDTSVITVGTVGTTSTRTLEANMKKYGKFKATSENTDIFIYPGYKFKMVDKLITNFHLPESTLIMLVSALSSKENVLNAYDIAVKIKEALSSNEMYMENAQSTAVTLISNLVKNLNPNIPDLNVEVEFME